MYVHKYKYMAYTQYGHHITCLHLFALQSCAFCELFSPIRFAEDTTSSWRNVFSTDFPTLVPRGICFGGLSIYE